MDNRLVAILTKDSLVATISLEQNQNGAQITTNDSRNTGRITRLIPKGKALRWMREAIMHSEENGWRLGYFGPPLKG